MYAQKEGNETLDEYLARQIALEDEDAKQDLLMMPLKVEKDNLIAKRKVYVEWLDQYESWCGDRAEYYHPKTKDEYEIYDLISGI